MKKIFLIIASLAIALIASVGAVRAHDTGQAHSHDEQKIIVVGRDEVVDKDYFATGDSVFVSGVVNGDVYAAAGKIVVDGTVNGDVISAGGSLEIPGRVTGDLRVAGGQITVGGNIEGSLTALGGSVVINEGARIGKSIVVGAGSLSSRGEIAKGATFGAGDATIDGMVGGDVRAGTSRLTLGDRANVSGNVEYWSENELTRIGNAQVAGSTTRHTPVSKEQANQGALGFWFFWAVVSAISGFIMGLVLLKLAPNFTADVIKTFRTWPFASIGIGLVALIAAPILFVLLLVTLIGIPFALILLFVMIIVWMFIKVFVALFIGGFIQERMKWKKSGVWALVIGLFLWAIVANIPVIGGMIVFIASLATIGALLWTKKDYYRKFSSKKLI